jgi:hypothetical protein
MSEKASSPEKKDYKEGHSKWLATARNESGSLFLGGLGGVLGYKILTLLGYTNPWTLLLGWAASALFSYAKAKTA